MYILIESNDTSIARWRRDCRPKEGETFGCSEHKFRGSGITVDECLCDTNLCNSKMGPILTSTSITTSTTTHYGTE